MTTKPDPVQPADDAALSQARALMTLRHAALAWSDAETGHPSISRIGFGLCPQGGPLTHPRLMIRARAAFVAADDPARPALRDHWLKGQPKAALYIDFADFAFVRLVPESALLNGGFARACRLSAADLQGPGQVAE